MIYEKMLDNKINKFKTEHLINWYYGNLAYRYENCDIDIYYKIKEIASKLVNDITYKEFALLMRENLGFKGIKRKSNDCLICKRIGLTDHWF